MHRPRCAARADNLLVCEALADGEHFPRGSPAPGLRDAKALVADSDTEGCPSAFGAVLVGHAVCSPAKGTDLERRAAGGTICGNSPFQYNRTSRSGTDSTMPPNSSLSSAFSVTFASMRSAAAISWACVRLCCSSMASLL